MTDRNPLSTGIGSTIVGDAVQRLGGSVRKRQIVTLHHLACSGGTIITKALAAMRSTVVLSEIHPDRVVQPEFHPLNQIRRGYGDLLNEGHLKAIRGHFRNEIGIAYDIAQSLGRTLVVRDHAHVDFVWQATDRSLLHEQLKSHFDIVPIVTARDPREVWISLKREGWFDGSIDDLCEAHCRLLDAFSDAAVFTYEDFTQHPDKVTAAMCALGGIEFEPDFQDRLDEITHLTGDSGRKSGTISPRPPKPLSDDDQKAFDASPAYAQFKKQLVERKHAPES